MEQACDDIAAEQAGGGNAARRWNELRVRQAALVEDNLTLPLQRLRERASSPLQPARAVLVQSRR